MISSIEITRFRGIREGKLEDLTPLVVLVGPNGCGKSSVLDAILIGASPLVMKGLQGAVERHSGVRFAARWLVWRPALHNPSVIKVTTPGNDSRTCELTLHSDTVLKCEVRGSIPEVGTTLSVEYADKVLSTGGPTHFVHELDCVPDVRLVEPREFDSEPALYELFSNAVELGRREEAKAIIAEIVDGMKDLVILTEGDRPVVHLVFEDHSVPVAIAGDGVYSLTRLSLELAARAHGVVLLEEPEVQQHPGAIRQSMRAVLAAVRRDIQVILTTHSLELIDSLLGESSPEDLEKLSLYRLQLEDGVLRSHRMSGPEVEFARSQIENDLR